MAISSSSSDGRRGYALPAAVIAALFGANAATALLLPPGDGDLDWQRWLGAQVVAGRLPHALGRESFAASGAPWVPQEWLFSALVALAHAHALTWLLALVLAACAAAALTVVALRCRRAGSGAIPVACVLALTGVAMAQSFGVRAQVAAWPLLAAFLLALDARGRARWWTIAIAAAWANVHASAVLAPFVALASAAGAACEHDLRRARGDAALAAGTALALCATPLGTALPVYAVTLARSPITHWIGEWQHTSLSDVAFTAGALPLFALALAAAVRAPRRARPLAVLLPFAYLAASAVRNVPLLAIVSAPPAAQTLARLLPTLGALRPRLGRAPAAALAAGACAVAALASAFAAHGVHDARPLGAIAQLAGAPGDHRLLCEDFAWCGPALASNRVRVFLDGRADPFPVPVWRAYDRVVHVRAGWEAVLRTYRVNALLVKRSGALDSAARRDGWRVARDGTVQLLMPPLQLASSKRLSAGDGSTSSSSRSSSRY